VTQQGSVIQMLEGCGGGTIREGEKEEEEEDEEEEGNKEER
jgi:hypothetical protein